MSWLKKGKGLAITLGLTGTATTLGLLFGEWQLHEANVVVLYILAVLLTARYTTGYVWGLVGGVLSVLLFNWFFTEPVSTLKVTDPSYLLTFLIMAITAVTTSTLTSRVKDSARRAQEKEQQTATMYRLTNLLSDAEDMDSIASIITQTVSDSFQCLAACLCFDQQGKVEKTYIQQKDEHTQIRRELQEDLSRQMYALHQECCQGEEFYDWPIYGRSDILGVVRIPRETARNLTESNRKMLHVILETAAIAMDRLWISLAERQTREAVERERYRSNLLRSISHDLRTPLTGIMGMSEMLMDSLPEGENAYTMAADIYRDAGHILSLVQNILNLTRLQEGKLRLQRQMEPLEEVVGSAVAAISKRYPGRKVDITMPENLLMVPVDPRLIDQVLVNLLDNAQRHTPQDQELGVAVEEKGNFVQVRVYDRGCGIKPQDLPHIFEAFNTEKSACADAGSGVGLGLAICQSIVQAHGGTIIGQNRAGGGAEFIFTLPLEVEESE